MRFRQNVGSGDMVYVNRGGWIVPVDDAARMVGTQVGIAGDDIPRGKYGMVYLGVIHSGHKGGDYEIN